MKYSAQVHKTINCWIFEIESNLHSMFIPNRKTWGSDKSELGAGISTLSTGDRGECTPEDTVWRQGRGGSLSSSGDESGEWAQYSSSMETGEGNTELGQRRAGDSSEDRRSTRWRRRQN
jgi:hypothetical protein